jgi:BirA family transcriptional regulator, biotin operon repressor / biotin---[acetyl-CoA-carboxylase] ligase
VASPYADLDRPPLSAAALRAALVRPGSSWSEIRVVAETGSTNADVLAAARGGAAAGLVVVAETQTAGRGRLNRTWVSPPRSTLTFSMLLRPAAARRRWGWLPLLTGVALAEAVTEHVGLEVRLKWPNDLLAADGRKLAGVLAEMTASSTGDAVAVGVGLNVSTRDTELADLPDASSLALAGASVLDRDSLLRALLRSFADTYSAWERCGGAPLPDFADRCATIGARVRVWLPGGETVTGTATGVDTEGRLLLRTEAGERVFSAGDVEHLR